MGQWLAEKYLQSSFYAPDFMVQGLMGLAQESIYCWEYLRGTPEEEILPESREIAEQSQALMQVHYDMPLSLFENFLGPSMKYSMGLWEEGASTLEESQQQMLADVCRKAGLVDGMRVLDIGCGFGSFAAYVLHHYPHCKVHGLTMSETQATYLRARMAEPGHPLNSDRFFLIQQDFNDADFDLKFDCVFSIGMFEHITNLDRALEKIRSFIAHTGRCFLHFIVFQPHGRIQHHPQQNGLIDRYVFPGGRIWAVDALHGHARHFQLAQQWVLNGSNYRRTIECWLQNLRRNQDALLEKGQLTQHTLKLWTFYLQACISTFGVRGGRYYCNGQYLLLPR